MSQGQDSAGTNGRRPRGVPMLALTAALLGILLSAISISFLATNVQREVNALAVANSDTTQWTPGADRGGTAGPDRRRGRCREP
jgi:hypothetical protein